MTYEVTAHLAEYYKLPVALMHYPLASGCKLFLYKLDEDAMLSTQYHMGQMLASCRVFFRWNGRREQEERFLIHAK
jgi:hypothetical protein